MERRIELATQTEFDMQSVREYCERASRNIGNLSFNDRRTTLEMLNIRVMVNQSEITLEVIVPIEFEQRALFEHNVPYLFSLPVQACTSPQFGHFTTLNERMVNSFVDSFLSQRLQAIS